jgi:hypothetical protein|uniref:Tail assembly protein n=1 Tax=Siphoviridae sp. ctVqj4 TaxID=2826359 RepID=A0A8S5NL29_9CAUD|nr:MAG TPA: tail assembly protein [Siphoviridae sp. ctVqj4]
MDIIISANNNETVLVLPVIPEKMPEMSQTYNHTTFDAVAQEINLIGNKGLRTVTLQSFFPVNKNYSFQRPGSEKDGWKYVAFFNRYADLKVPIRMIWLDDLQEISNMAYTIESYAFQINKIKDIDYTIELKEFRFVDAKKVV